MKHQFSFFSCSKDGAAYYAPHLAKNDCSKWKQTFIVSADVWTAVQVRCVVTHSGNLVIQLMVQTKTHVGINMSDCHYAIVGTIHCQRRVAMATHSTECNLL